MSSIFIRLNEVSELLGVSKSTIKRWIKRGVFIQPCNYKLPNVCKSTPLFFFKSDLNRWIASLKK
ncbi:MAG: helix-turn-helix domain-containing protein [Synergistaceae bacterium]|nr:helix-turn-helix domain-containing protein [Candidatus Equadaptatus faecalis]